MLNVSAANCFCFFFCTLFNIKFSIATLPIFLTAELYVYTSSFSIVLYQYNNTFSNINLSYATLPIFFSWTSKSAYVLISSHRCICKICKLEIYLTLCISFNNIFSWATLPIFFLLELWIYSLYILARK